MKQSYIEDDFAKVTREDEGSKRDEIRGRELKRERRRGLQRERARAQRNEGVGPLGFEGARARDFLETQLRESLEEERPRLGSPRCHNARDRKRGLSSALPKGREKLAAIPLCPRRSVFRRLSPRFTFPRESLTFLNVVRYLTELVLRVGPATRDAPARQSVNSPCEA